MRQTKHTDGESEVAVNFRSWLIRLFGQNKIKQEIYVHCEMVDFAASELKLGAIYMPCILAASLSRRSVRYENQFEISFQQHSRKAVLGIALCLEFRMNRRGTQNSYTTSHVGLT